MKGKIAIVTDSTSGIGLGVARTLATAGADILLNGFLPDGFGAPVLIEKLLVEFKGGSGAEPAGRPGSHQDRGELRLPHRPACSRRRLAAFVKKEVGGTQGVLVTAVSPKAFEQALGMVSRGGTVSLVGLPPGSFPLPIFDTVLNGIIVRGSIIGTRLDLQEALNFAGAGKVKATVATEPLENISQVLAGMHAGDIEGRIVIDFQK